MRYIHLLFITLLLTCNGTYATESNVHQILSSSDAVRNPDKPFSLTTTLVEYRKGVMTNTSSIVVYSRMPPNQGQFMSIVRFLTPERDLNKLMLKNGNDLWFFDPNSKATIRISPQQRLLGQAANGDVVTVNFAADYKAELTGEEDIEDGNRKIRHCFKLKLSAASTEVTYSGIELWVETNSYKPIKARFYSESKRLLKTAFYRGYRSELGKERPTEIIIIDGLDPTWVTIMRYSNYAFRNIEDTWFQRAYLSHFNPDL